jgi:hypothetical protein
MLEFKHTRYVMFTCSRIFELHGQRKTFRVLLITAAFALCEIESIRINYQPLPRTPVFFAAKAARYAKTTGAHNINMNFK